MKTLNYLVFIFTLQITIFSNASTLGDQFIRLGQKINSAVLSSEQIQNLSLKLDEAQDILNGGSGASEFVCIQGTVSGPGNQNIWTGDSQACSNPNKVYIQGDYACVTGALYGAKGSLKKQGFECLISQETKNPDSLIEAFCEKNLTTDLQLPKEIEQRIKSNYTSEMFGWWKHGVLIRDLPSDVKPAYSEFIWKIPVGYFAFINPDGELTEMSPEIGSPEEDIKNMSKDIYRVYACEHDGDKIPGCYMDMAVEIKTKKFFIGDLIVTQKPYQSTLIKSHYFVQFGMKKTN